jgi:hypothetical protein
VNFSAIFKTNQVRLPGCPRKSGDFFDKITGRLYFGLICLPFAPQEDGRAFGIVARAISDKRISASIFWVSPADADAAWAN